MNNNLLPLDNDFNKYNLFYDNNLKLSLFNFNE